MAYQIVVLIEDLFVQSKVAQIGRSHDINVIGSSLTTIRDAVLGSDGDSLVIVDLDSSEHDPFVLAEQLKRDLGDRIVLFGLYPHVKRPLAERARKVGFDHVVPNREFVKTLDGLLARLSGGKRD